MANELMNLIFFDRWPTGLSFHSDMLIYKSIRILSGMSIMNHNKSFISVWAKYLISVVPYNQPKILMKNLMGVHLILESIINFDHS